MCPDPASWSARYAAENTPWDHGTPHPELRRLIEAGALAPPSPSAPALVPGCGRGHDALALAEAGWRVTAIDFAQVIEDQVTAVLGAQGGNFLLEDALEHRGGPYDLLFEHTFFCALEPAERPRYGAFAARVLRPGARLVALLFPVGKAAQTGGPPWGFGLGDLEHALGSDFLLRAHEPALRPIAARSWREELAVFERAVR